MVRVVVPDGDDDRDSECEMGADVGGDVGVDGDEHLEVRAIWAAVAAGCTGIILDLLPSHDEGDDIVTLSWPLLTVVIKCSMVMYFFVHI